MRDFVIEPLVNGKEESAMFKRNLKSAFMAFLLGILFAASVSAAFAATADSPYKYYGPYAGYSYLNQASVVSQSGTGVWAYT